MLGYKTRPDGNCLFSAVAHQLEGFDIESRKHIELTKRLRQQAVQYFVDNQRDKACQDLMSMRIRDEFPHLDILPPSEATCEFLSQLARDTVWGGTECITAMAECLDCVIRTFWENGTTTTIGNHRNRFDRLINIVYRQHNGRWNHYDAFGFVGMPSSSEETSIRAFEAPQLDGSMPLILRISQVYP